MKKLLFALLLSISVHASADNEFRYVPNNAEGYIFFTYSPCVYKDNGARVPNSFYVYSTNGTGYRIQDGCYTYKDPFYVINWNSGGRTNIPVSSTAAINK